MNRNIVIVGGGTAGWMTALFVKKHLYKCNVTLIESQDIGILGAGEGTTPHFLQFLNELDIPLSDMFKHARATVKNGIKFTDWNGDGSDFFHSFHTPEINEVMNNKYLLLDLIRNGESMDKVNYAAAISKQNRVPFVSKIVTPGDENDWQSRYHTLCKYGVHFDARALAAYLADVGKSRGINHVQGNVIDINSSTSGVIENLAIDSGEQYDCDFVFDCTGFARLIIGKHFNSEWKDYRDYIPNDRAIPFFIDNSQEENLPPYTEAIAMKYGWVWKIPVQGRYGCGYVFDSSIITDEQAIEEIEARFNTNVSNRKGFNFKAGCFKEVWIQNCMAVGLSAGFIEPLEATNLWVAITQLTKIKNSLHGIFNLDTPTIDLFNKSMLLFNSSILDFITLHYITQRCDTVFWQNAQTKKDKPVIRDILELSNNIVLEGPEIIGIIEADFTFAQPSILTLLLAQKLCKKETLEKYEEALNGVYNPEWFYDRAISIQRATEINASVSLHHSEFINFMKW